MVRRIVVAALLCVLVGLVPARFVTSPAHAADYKLITISLSQQSLTAWENGRAVMTTPVTTGNAALPTPAGWYSVFAKYSPYTFVSPWPQGSYYYYPPSYVNFAMEFISGGYFIHDAPWRTVYGPGSNASAGSPGSNYTGTHGCVNVPYNAMRFLYYWTPYGTPVHVYW